MSESLPDAIRRRIEELSRPLTCPPFEETHSTLSTWSADGPHVVDTTLAACVQAALLEAGFPDVVVTVKGHGWIDVQGVPLDAVSRAMRICSPGFEPLVVG